MNRKFLSISMACLMATSSVAPAFAADVTGNTDVYLSVDQQEEEPEPEVIQVRVPDSIVINMDSKGTVSVADNYKVENLSKSLDVEVTGITVTGKNGWAIKDFSEDLAAKEADTKELVMQFRGDGTQDGGSVPVTDGNWDIGRQSSLMLNVAAKLPKQNIESEEMSNIAQVDYEVSTLEDASEIVSANMDVTTPPSKTAY